MPVPPAKRHKLTVFRNFEDVDTGVGSSPAAIDEANDEAYVSTIFKSVCNFVLSSPEKHVFSDVDFAVIHSFLDLPSRLLFVVVMQRYFSNTE